MVGSAGIIRGTVNVPGTKVTVTRYGSTTPVASYTTAAKGTFEFRDLPPGRYQITFSDDEDISDRDYLLPEIEGTTGWTVEVEPNKATYITALLTPDFGLQDIEVESDYFTVPKRTTGKSEGAKAEDGLVDPIDDELSHLRDLDDVPSHDLEGIGKVYRDLERAKKFKRPPKKGEVGIIKGTVNVPGATVEVVGHGSYTTAARGTFEFRGLPVGRHKIIVRAEGYGTIEKTVTIRPNRPAEVDFEMMELDKTSEVSPANDPHPLGIRDALGGLLGGSKRARRPRGFNPLGGLLGGSKRARRPGGNPLGDLLSGGTGVGSGQPDGRDPLEALLEDGIDSDGFSRDLPDLPSPEHKKRVSSPQPPRTWMGWPRLWVGFGVTVITVLVGLLLAQWLTDSSSGDVPELPSGIVTTLTTGGGTSVAPSDAAGSGTSATTLPDATEPSTTTESGASSPAVLRTDGIYGAASDICVLYLRFFEDSKTVVSACSAGSPGEVAAWLRPDGPIGISTGTYVLNGTEISFTVTVPNLTTTAEGEAVVIGVAGTIDYEGTVGVDSMTLSSRSNITAYVVPGPVTFDWVFEFFADSG